MIIELEASIFQKTEESGTYPCIRLEHKGGAAMIGYCTNFGAEQLLEKFRSEFEYNSKEKEFEYHIRWKGNTGYIIRKYDR